MTTHRSRQDAPSSVSESGAGRRPIDQVTDAASMPAVELRAQPLRLGLDVEPGQHELHLVAEPAELVDADLQLRRRRLTAYAGDPHPVLAVIGELDAWSGRP